MASVFANVPYCDIFKKFLLYCMQIHVPLLLPFPAFGFSNPIEPGLPLLFPSPTVAGRGGGCYFAVHHSYLCLFVFIVLDFHWHLLEKLAEYSGKTDTDFVCGFA